jgi:hypothetical protein
MLNSLFPAGSSSAISHVKNNQSCADLAHKVLIVLDEKNAEPLALGQLCQHTGFQFQARRKIGRRWVYSSSSPIASSVLGYSSSTRVFCRMVNLILGRRLMALAKTLRAFSRLLPA